MEDVDVVSASRSRVKTKKPKKEPKELNGECKSGVIESPDKSPESEPEMEDDYYSFLTFAGLTNAIDGIIDSDGRIIIMTTNHAHRLDEALVGPGRIDLRVKFGYVDEYMYKEFTKRFFGDNVSPNKQVKYQLTPAKLQHFARIYKNDSTKFLEETST